MLCVWGSHGVPCVLLCGHEFVAIVPYLPFLTSLSLTTFLLRQTHELSLSAIFFISSVVKLFFQIIKTISPATVPRPSLGGQLQSPYSLFLFFFSATYHNHHRLALDVTPAHARYAVVLRLILSVDPSVKRRRCVG